MDREQLLQEILRLPWRTVLTRPLVPRQDQPMPRESSLTCALTVRGAWCGRMFVRCDRTLAGRLALRLHGRTTPHDNVQAVHWLTTTLTAALRRVMPRELGSGFPLVIDHEPEWSFSEPTLTLHFTSGSSALSIALYEMKDRGMTTSESEDSSESDDAANEPPVDASSFFAELARPLTGT